MHRISLNFESKRLETKYREDTRSETQKRFFSFVILELVFSLIFLLYTIAVSVDTLLEILKFISISALILILLLMKKFKFRFLGWLLRIIFVGFIVLFTELIKMVQLQSNNSDNTISFAIPLQLVLSMLWLSRINWLLSAAFYFCSLCYFFARVINVSPNMHPHFSFVILGLFLSFLSFCYMSYTQERMEKSYYKSLYDSCESLNYFKALLQNIIPSPIFIFDFQKNELKFNNNSASQFLCRNSLHSGLMDSTSSRESRLKKKENYVTEFSNLLSKIAIIKEKESDNLERKGEIPDILRQYFDDPDKIPLFSDSSDQPVEFLTLNTVIFNKDFFSEDDEKIAHLESLKHKRFYELKVLKIFWDKTVCLLVIFNENTDAFRISELLSLDLYKNQLLASVSHDLRTPLNGLIGMLELTTTKIRELDLKETLTLALKSAQLLNFLVNDILDFSQINFKKLRLNIDDINLLEIIEEIRNLIEFQAKEKKIEFLIELPRCAMRRISSDANRIKQILLNLLSNSLKFTHDGFIKLQIEDFSHDSCLDYKLMVEDTGVGIKSEDISKLFKLFGRLDVPKKLNKTGIGLGLTISKMLSKLLSPQYPDGLQVESEFGKGSRFSFHLTNIVEKGNFEDFDLIEERPKILLPELQTYETIEEKQSLFALKSMDSMDQLNNKRILIVDDDLINIMIAEQYLEFFKIKSLRALNGLEAFQMVESDVLQNKEEICLIIMDCNMPILDGFQASEKINDFLREEGARSIPILAVTANLTIENKELCKKSGMNFYLEKPMRREIFKNMIEDILKIRLT